MNQINELKDRVNTTTLRLLLLSGATAGIYPVLWIYRTNGIIREVTGHKMVGDGFIFWYAGLLGYGLALGGDGFIAVAGGLCTMASGVLILIWTFKARAALTRYALEEFKLDLKMNAFYSVVFYVFYVNFCINAMEEEKRKQDILFSNINVGAH